MIVKVTNTRICFCDNIFVPCQIKGKGELKYSASFLVPKEDPQIKMLQGIMVQLADEKWGEKGAQTLKSLLVGKKVFLRDGDEKADYAGFEGNMFFNALRLSKKGAPLVILQDKTPVIETDGIIFAGCYVDVSCELYAQDNAYGKRINCALRAIRFLRTGDCLAGNAPASEEEFDDLADIGNTESLF